MIVEAPRPRTLTLPSDQEASGRSLGAEETELLQSVIRCGVLTSTKGSAVRGLERDFAARLGSRYACACSSGTAAIHAAIAALDPEPGDEVITSPITDMGAITPILYQSAIPVFADVDPRTLNVTARTLEARLSERTRAIVVTHLFGNPCEMDEILALARKWDLPLVEDCAQAYLAESGGRTVGTMGRIGCFSLQQGKHITTGEGGLLTTDDEALARRIRLFVNKAWDYGHPSPDHRFLALNYRMSELQGAVGAAQLGKLDAGVRRRRRLAARLTERLAGLDAVASPAVHPANVHVYWRYGLRVDASRLPGGPDALAAALKSRGIAAAPRYIRKPAFQCEVFREQRTFGRSHFPFDRARPEALDYSADRFPGVFRGLERVLVLPWNERFTEEDVDDIGESIEQALADLGAGRR